MVRLRLLLIALGVFLLSSAALAQTSYTSVASGPWSQASAWSPNGVPGSADSVTIQAAHTITVDGARSVTNATVNGGLNLGNTLSVTNTLAVAGTISGGGGPLTSNGVFNWTAGTLSGATVTVPFGTTMNISGASGKLMEGSAHLVIAGTANWTGGTITLNTSALLDVQGGGVFDAQSDNTITNSYYSGSISNSGTFRKTAGAASTTINSGVPFANLGKLTTTSGKLVIESLTLYTGSVLGPGFSISSGTTNIAGPSVVEPGATVTLSGGTLTGASSLTVNGLLDWTGGLMSGGASVIVPFGKTMTISGPAQKTMEGGFTLAIAGTAAWTGGKIVLNSSSLLDIQAGGVFDAQTDNTIINTYYSGSISNNGTFKKTAGSGVTTVDSGVPFNNSARIEIVSGSTDFQALTLNAGSVIGGTKFTIVSGATTIAGASTLEAGAVMTLAGGTLQGGSAALTTNGTFQFTGGSMSGSATVNVPATGALHFTGASSKTLGAYFDLNIAGTATWTAGTIILNSGATLDVLTGGLLDLKSNDTIVNTYYSGSFSNAGTLRKSAGGGASTVSSGVPFTNSGRIEILSGTFAAATSTLAAGTVIAGTGFSVSTGTTNVTGTATVETGASMTLATGGALSGSVPLTVDGTLQWTGGSMSGTFASANISTAGTLNISGAATKTLGGGFDLNLLGTAHWTGGTIQLNDGGLLNITASGLFLVEHDGFMTNTYYNGSISNAGIFRKSAGGGAATVSSGVPFANTGRIDILNGTFSSSTLTLNAGTIISGTGFTIAAGTTTVSGASSVETGASMKMTGGTLTGTATLTIDGTLDWSGGAMSDGASVTVPAGKSMTISGPAQKFMYSGFTLNIAGTANWTAGPIAINNSSLLNIQAGGVFDAQTDGTISNTFYNGSISNSGTFRKSAGAGAVTLSGVPFNNTGRIEILSGTMSATPLTLNAGTVIAGTGFTINSGTTTLGGPSSVELGSSMTLAGGALNGSSTLTVNGTLHWIGGNMDGTGTVTIPAGSLLLLSGTGNKVLYSGFNLLNAGTMQWTGGNIHVNNSSLLHNQATGLFLIQTDASIVNSYYNGTFTNSGILRKNNSTATTSISSGVPFTNTGTIDIQSGALQLTNPSFSGTTILNFGLAGTTPLTGYGRLVVSSAVALAGTIDVNVIGAFVPQGGDQYAVITYSSRSGTLAESLSFGSGRSFTTTYNATNLTLTASGPTITPPLSPNTDTNVGGALVTINGSGFTSTPTVTFGGTPSALVTFVNSTQLTAVAPPHAPGAFDVVVTNPDGQPTTAYSAFTYTANGDLSLTMTAAPTRVATGAAVTYTLTVNNSGPSSSTSVAVTDTLPSGMTLVSAGGSGWTCTNNAATPPTITCTMPTLAAGTAAPIGISVNAPATANASLTNTASVTSATVDPIPGNNSGSATIEVITPPAIITVTTAADSGAGTLRQAFDDAIHGLCTSPCTIHFNVSPLAPIQPLTALPTLTQPVVIDGSTQPGYATTPLVEINGSLCACGIGVSLGGLGSTMRALSITGFSTAGLQLTGTGSHLVAASFIGVTTSQTASANGIGIDVDSPSNTIGGTAGDGNVISANAGNGIDIGAGADATIIEGNRIGTDPNGSSAMPNAAGVAIGNSLKASVANNTIAFNTTDGIYVSGGSGHHLSTNTMYANGESAIDLLSVPEPTVNDAGDTDSGPNGLQNTPILTSAVLVSGNLRVTLDVDSASTGTTSLQIELFDDTGAHLHTACFNGNALSNALLIAPAGTTAAGQSVVATATSFSTACGATTPVIADGTSEYSSGAVVVACTPATVTVSTTAPTFCTGSGVTLSANASGSNPPYSYQWYSGATPLGGQTAQTLVVTTAGNYSVTVTDAIGCAGTSAPMSIAEATPPTATITAGGATTFCEGGGVVLNASNGASWLWSPGGATTQSITATTSGNYSVTVTGANGCSATSAPTNVNVQTTPVATIAASGPLTFCPGGSVTLTASNGTSWLWSNGASSQSITVNAAGNFSVTVSNGSCSATSAATTVTVDTPPSVAISGPTSICPNTQFVLDAGSGFSSYAWSGGETSQTITVSQSVSKTYSVTVTNATGCSATASHIVAITASPDAAISAPATVLRNSSGNNASALAQPGATYAWTASNGTIDSGQGTRAVTFTAFESGFVQLQLTVTISGCSTVKNISVPIEAADLGIIKTAASTVDTGASLVYTIAVTNHGPSAATGVTVTDYLPSAITLVSITPGPWSCTQSGNEVHCTGDAAVGSSSTITITVKAPQQAGTIRNLVKVFSASDPNPANDFSAATTTVIAPVVCTNVAPVLLAPTSGANVASPIAFAWTAVPQATGYRLWIEVDGAAAQELGTTGDALSLTATVPSGAIVAYVDALFASCPSTRSAAIAFTVPAPGPCARATATPLAPVNNAIVNSSNVDFHWSEAAGASGYRLWASIDGAAPAVLGTTDATSLIAHIDSGDVLWWIESLYEGCASTESAHVHFTIPAKTNCSTARPQLLAPADSAHLTSTNVTFTWSSVEDAVGYEVYLAAGKGAPVLIGTTDAATTSLTHGVPTGELEWTVVVNVDRCPSRESQKSRFSVTLPAACIDRQRSILVAPLPDAVTTSPLDFSWSAPAGATRYELYVVRGTHAPQLVKSTNANFANDVELANGRVQWFVRTFFGDSCPPLDSQHQALEVVAQPAACAALASPVITAPGQISSGLPFLVQWTPAIGATRYQLDVAANAGFTGAQTTDTTATSQQLTRTNNGTAPIAVYTRVRAIDDRCTPAATFSAFGPISAIFILPVISEEATAPMGTGGSVSFAIPLGAELAGQSFTATPNASWLSVSPTSGIVAPTGTTLTATAATATLPVGASLSGVTIALTAPSNGNVRANATTFKTPTLSVSLVTPVTPALKSTPPPDALIIPAVAHANGINSTFQSDVRVSNTSPLLLEYQLTFTPSGSAGITAGRQTTFSVEPGRTVALDDVLAGWFGTGGDSTVGVLEIRPLTETATSTPGAAFSGLPNLVTFASSRTFNVTPNGTYGQSIPAIPFANFVGRSSDALNPTLLSLQQIAQSDRFRTNLGIVEGSGEPASLLVRVFGDGGQQLTQFPVELAGGEHTQLNAFLSQQGIESLSDGRVEIEVLSGGGKVTAYASVLDNQTSDPLLVSPVTLADSGATRWVLPGAADLNNGFANWQTDMRVFNAGSEPVDATLTFHSQNGGTPKTANITIPAGQVRQFDKTVSTLFHATNEGGAIHIDTAGAARLVATARTYNQTSAGTYGQFISAVTSREAAGLDSRPLQLLQLEQSSRFRTNVGLAEVTGNAVKLEISVIPADAKVTAVTEVTLTPNEFRQLGSLLESAGLAETFNARVAIRVIEGNGRVTAYASVIDALTNDPTYIPAQ